MNNNLKIFTDNTANILKLKYLFFYKPRIQKTTSLILIKNFFFFFLFLEFFALQNCNKVSYYFKKKIKNKLSIIRSPNRYKKSQVKIYKKHYFLYINVVLNFKNSLSNNFKNLKKFLIFFKFLQIFYFFESAIVYLLYFKLYSFSFFLVLYC